MSMTKEQFQREKMYQAMMRLARKMRSEGLISSPEYERIQALMLQKYHPIFGSMIDCDALT